MTPEPQAKQTERREKRRTFKKFLSTSRIITGILLLLLLAASIAVILRPAEHSAPKQLKLNTPFQEDIIAKVSFDARLKKKDADVKPSSRETILYFRRNEDDTGNLKADFQKCAEEIKRRYIMEDLAKEGDSYGIPEDADIRSRKLIPAIQRFTREQNDFLARNIDGGNSMARLQQDFEEMLNAGIFALQQYRALPDGCRVSVVFHQNNEMEAREKRDLHTVDSLAGKLADDLLKSYPGKDLPEFRENLLALFRVCFESGNVRKDDDYTRKKQPAAEHVSAEEGSYELRHYHAGDLLFEMGDVVDEQDISVWEQHEKAMREDPLSYWHTLIPKILIVILVLLFVCVCISHIHPEIARNNRSVWLIGIIAILAILLNDGTSVLSE